MDTVRTVTEYHSSTMIPILNSTSGQQHLRQQAILPQQTNSHAHWGSPFCTSSLGPWRRQAASYFVSRRIQEAQECQNLSDTSGERCIPVLLLYSLPGVFTKILIELSYSDRTPQCKAQAPRTHAQLPRSGQEECVTQQQL